jgi:hypothetical protein
MLFTSNNAVLIDFMVLLYTTFLHIDDGKKLIENIFGQIIFFSSCSMHLTTSRSTASTIH